MTHFSLFSGIGGIDLTAYRPKPLRIEVVPQQTYPILAAIAEIARTE